MKPTLILLVLFLSSCSVFKSKNSESKSEEKIIENKVDSTAKVDSAKVVKFDSSVTIKKDSSKTVEVTETEENKVEEHFDTSGKLTKKITTVKVSKSRKDSQTGNIDFIFNHSGIDSTHLQKEATKSVESKIVEKNTEKASSKTKFTISWWWLLLLLLIPLYKYRKQIKNWILTVIPI